MFYLYSLQVYAIICYAILMKWYFIAPTRLFKLYAMIWEIGTKGLMICYGMSWNLSKNLSTQRNFKHWKKNPHKHAQNIHDTTLTFEKRYIATDDSFNYLKNISRCRFHNRSSVSSIVRYIFCRTQYNYNPHAKLW